MSEKGLLLRAGHGVRAHQAASVVCPGMRSHHAASVLCPHHAASVLMCVSFSEMNGGGERKTEFKKPLFTHDTRVFMTV